MKEITRIHLAATPYNIDVTAKKELEKYIGAITKVLGADDDALREIEARMVELLMERGVTGEKVITTADVVAIKQQLGAPGDFVNDDAVVSERPRKRLMRDAENGMLGGVLAGFAAYTGVDVIWWRIVAIILGLVSFGTSTLLYIVLWVVMPGARTAADRLQMKGVEPTLDNIRSEANREMIEVPVRQKSLVVLLRVVGVLGLICVAIGVVMVLAFGIFGVGMVAWREYSWLTNGWLIGAMIASMLSGILFVALLTVGIYGLWAWKATRKMMVVSLGIIATGLLLFGVAVGSGMYGINTAQTVVREHTKTYRVDLDKLANVHQLQVDSTATPLEYHVTSGKPYAEVTSLQYGDNKKIPLLVASDATYGTLKVGDVAQDCPNRFVDCGMGAMVKVYGPALDKLTTGDVSLQYHTVSQPKLNLEIGKAAVVSLHGSVGALDVKLADSARFDAQNAAVGNVRLVVTQANEAQFGTVKELHVVAPKSCGANSLVEYGYADRVMVNEDQGTDGSSPCLRLNNLGEINDQVVGE